VQIKFNQKGVTLVELLVVLVIFGILISLFSQVYQLAISSWQSVSNRFQFEENILNLNKYVTSDIREANQFLEVNDTEVVLKKKDLKVRYRVQITDTKIEVFREQITPLSKEWIASPRFSVADFSLKYEKYIPKIVFNKISPIQLTLTISTQNFKQQTIITRRCSF